MENSPFGCKKKLHIDSKPLKCYADFKLFVTIPTNLLQVVFLHIKMQDFVINGIFLQLIKTQGGIQISLDYYKEEDENEKETKQKS